MERITHFEIPASEPEKTMDFYKDVFGWNFNQFAGQEYWLAVTGEDGTQGINGAVLKRRDAAQPVTNSLTVKDIDASIKKVEESGGQIVVPKMAIPGMGWYAYFKDPDGNILGMMQNDTAASGS